MMSFDLLVSYDLAKFLVEENGFDSWLKFLGKKFPKKEIYHVSTHWFDDRKYICKAKGKYGDLIIGWEG